MRVAVLAAVLVLGAALAVEGKQAKNVFWALVSDAAVAVPLLCCAVLPLWHHHPRLLSVARLLGRSSVWGAAWSRQAGRPCCCPILVNSPA